MRGEDLSDFQRGQIFALRRHAAWSYGQIANTLGLQYHTVARYLQRQLWVADRKGHCGVVRKTTNRFDRAVSRNSLSNPFKTSVKIRQEMEGVKKVSGLTIRRRLKEAGIRCHKTAIKPKLSQQHIVNRYQWSLQHRNWDIEWSKVIFSDESHCCGVMNHDHVWRKAGTRYDYNLVHAKENRSHANVTFWGAFSLDSFTPLVRIIGRNTSQSYIDILRTHLLPLVHEMQNNCIFQHDNAPIHVANVVSTFLQNSNIPVLPWPAISPDINPIENVWARLKAAVSQCGMSVTNNDGLFQVLQQQWTVLMNNPEARAQYIYSMTRRVDALIASNDAYTKYYR